MTEPLSLDDTKALRKEGELAAFIKGHMTAARTNAAHRRGLVLRHPDLAEQLTKAPCRFSKPEFWNGFIPPAQWGQKINTEPSRRVLLDLVAEAERRQRQPLAPVAEEEAA